MSEQSTALAAREQEDPFALQLQSSYQRDKMIRAMASQIAKESWGKNLSPHTQAAMARYAMEAGLDPVRHIDVLGGRVYINAAAYMDRLASDAEFEAVEFTPIHDDENERVRWGIPKHALAAYLVTITHRGRTFQEVGYAPKRANDSVGKEFPHEKARTSGIRRAARMAVPMWTQRMEQQFESVEALLAAQKSREILPAQPAAARQLVPAVRRSGDAANDWETVEVDAETVGSAKVGSQPPPGVSQAQHEENLRRAAAEEVEALDERVPDGYGDDLFTDPE